MHSFFYQFVSISGGARNKSFSRGTGSLSSGVPGKWVVFFPVPGKWVVLFFRYLENVLFSVPGKWVALFWTLLGRTKNIKFFRFWGGEILLFF